MFKKPCPAAAIAVSLAIGAASLTATAAAAEFASVGTKGTLTITVKVEGAGKVNSEGPGWDYYKWNTRNEAKLRYILTATEPMVDASQFANLSTAANGDNNSAEGDETDDDSSCEDAWDEKIDACNGDESCEMRVNLEKMKDPRFKKLQAKAMGVMAAMQEGGLDFDPSVQIWNTPTGVVNGTVSIQGHRDTYGILSETGGGKTEEHCAISGQETLNTKPSGYGDTDAMLSVNFKKFTYELGLRADWSVDVANSCEPGTKRSSKLLGFPPADAASWNQVLVVKGMISGSGSQFSLNGQQTWQGNLTPAGNEPVKVTISWEFK